MKAIFAFLGFVVFIILVIVLIVRMGDNRTQLEPVPSLSDAAASDAVFEFTEFGPINAEENHFRVVIKVSRSSREAVVYQGYNNLRVATQTLGNSQAAFESFLSALDREGYRNERQTRYDTPEGLCPLDSRYVFSSDQFDEDFTRWTTDCRERGNFGGNFTTVRRLYQEQIPEYNTFISDARAATGLAL